MATHMRINEASLRMKLEQMSETLDGSLRLLNKRLSPPPPPIANKYTKRSGLSRYMTQVSRVSYSSRSPGISKKNTQVSKESEENSRGKPPPSRLSINRAFKSIQPVSTALRKYSEHSPGGQAYSSVRSQDSNSPRASRKATLQIPTLTRAPRSVKFNSETRRDEGSLDSPSVFLTETDIYRLEALREEAQQEFLSKRSSLQRKLIARKQTVNFKELQRRVIEANEKELDRKHRLENEDKQQQIQELEEELLMGMEDDGQEKRTLKEVADTIAEAFEEDRKKSEGEEMLLSTYSHEEIVNAFQMARRAAQAGERREEKPQSQREKAIQAEMKSFLEKNEFFRKIRMVANEKGKPNEEVKDEREQFVEACIRAKVVPLPMLSKLQNGVLTLDSYKLNRGLCDALGSTVLRTTRGVRKLMLQNNGISDSELRVILEGLRENRDLRNLDLAHNQLGPKSTEILVHLLTREEPLQLTELKIQKLKGSPLFLNRTLEAMAGKCKLRVLGLSEAGLNDHSVSLLEDFVATNPKLENLDISFNRILPQTSLRLLFTLAAHAKGLRYLNLSWNSLHPPDQGLASEIAFALAQLVRNSLSLLHLNLNRTGLVPEQAFTLFRAVRKSKSLLSIHLSGNSIDRATKAKLRSILESSRFRVYQDNIATKVKPRPKMLTYNPPSPPRRPSKAAILVDSEGTARAVPSPQCQEMQGELQDTLGFRQLERRMALPGSEGPAPHLSPLGDAVLKDQKRKPNILEKRELAKGKKPEGKERGLDKFIDKSDLLVYSRVLGHPEILKSRQWYETNECWVCEKWRYMLVLWSPRISQRAYIQAQDIQKEQIFDKIEIANFYASVNLKSDPASAPRLAGSFTDWKERDMVSLPRFCEKLLIAQERQTFNLKALISRSEKKKLGLRQMAALDIKSRLSKEEIRSLRPQLASLSRHFWPQFLGELSRYPPLYAGLDLEAAAETVGSSTDEKLWVWAGFVPPGKHSYSVLYPQGAKLDPEICFNQVIVQPRAHPLDISLKKTKIALLSRRFDKAKSVFRDWRQDTDGLIQRSVFIDLGLSKLSRLVRDPNELGRVEDVLLDFARPLKDLFTHTICRSDYPSIAWLDFAKLCQSLRIVDKHLTLTAIDQAFIAVNVELESLDNNPDRDLCRYEFYEILVRMARTKYLDSKREQSLAAATRRFIRDEVLAYASLEPWQEFRDQFLWTLPVNDLLEANLDGLRSLFSSYMHHGQRYLTVPSLKTMLLKDARLRLTEKDVLFCFGYSKMTVIDEMKAKEQYDRLVFVEFLEVLGRVADLNFRDTELESETLEVKLALILEVMLPLVGYKRKDPAPPPPPDSHTDNDDEEDEEAQ